MTSTSANGLPASGDLAAADLLVAGQSSLASLLVVDDGPRIGLPQPDAARGSVPPELHRTAHGYRYSTVVRAPDTSV